MTFVCAPVLGVTPGTICMWQEDSVFWLLFDFSGQGQQAAVPRGRRGDAVRSA